MCHEMDLSCSATVIESFSQSVNHGRVGCVVASVTTEIDSCWKFDGDGDDSLLPIDVINIFIHQILGFLGV